MRIAIADPPYPGQSEKHYGDHQDYAGEVDHRGLIRRLCTEYDGWALHTSTPALRRILPMCPEDVRVGAWVKPFAAFKRNVKVAYAWEPVIFFGGGTPDPERSAMILRDYIAEPITMKRGLAGAKPEAVCHWVFEVLGMSREDELHDLFPGTGAISRAWESWRSSPTLFEASAERSKSA
jgi:hypothetical protein